MSRYVVDLGENKEFVYGWDHALGYFYELWDNSLLLKYSDCLELIVKKIDKITSLNIKNNITNNDLYIFSNGIINIIFRYFLISK
jgi:hypothetical protein